jgi:uncharacterized protein with HEPN domain
MPKREVEFYIVDIFIAIDKIDRYTLNILSAEQLLHSELEWDATIRELEIIGEATNSLLKANFLDNSYRVVVDFRNQINHGYFGINENIVWDVIKSYLIEFKEEFIVMIKNKNIVLDEAITCAKEDNKFSKKTTKLLNALHVEFEK